MTTDTKPLADEMPHTCPYCDGRGWVGPVFVDRASGGELIARIECTHCGSTGRWDAAHMARYLEGRAHRDARVARGESLRECAHRLSVTPAELSSFETGRVLLHIPSLRSERDLP